MKEGEATLEATGEEMVIEREVVDTIHSIQEAEAAEAMKEVKVEVEDTIIDGKETRMIEANKRQAGDALQVKPHHLVDLLSLERIKTMKKEDGTKLEIQADPIGMVEEVRITAEAVRTIIEIAPGSQLADLAEVEALSPVSNAAKKATSRMNAHKVEVKAEDKANTVDLEDEAEAAVEDEDSNRHSLIVI